MTVVLTTHDMDEVDRLAHRVGIIDHGQLLVLDTPEHLKDRLGSSDILEIKLINGQEERLEELRKSLPENLRSFTYQEGTLRLVDLDTRAVLPALLEAFQRTRLETQDITIRKKTLEDVFIDRTGRSLRT
jgi:ABC-2 type transport system ATP-binding protein